jgi:hypothetical protein
MMAYHMTPNDELNELEKLVEKGQQDIDTCLREIGDRESQAEINISNLESSDLLKKAQIASETALAIGQIKSSTKIARILQEGQLFDLRSRQSELRQKQERLMLKKGSMIDF